MKVNYNRGDTGSVSEPDNVQQFENNNYYKSVIHNHPDQVLIASLKGDIRSMRRNFLLNNQDAEQLICFFSDKIKILLRENTILAFRRFVYELNRDDLSRTRIRNLPRFRENIHRFINNLGD